ncbi:MAG: hypothetical protein K1000chlam3_00343 [Chlamydiae bacterium]|nr:hypothetical protein [Chlamydiota bacterium]
MSELIEIAFENTSKKSILDFFNEFIDSENLLNYHFTNKEKTIEGTDGLLDLINKPNHDFNLFINLKKIKTDHFFSSYPSLNIIKEKGCYDFILILDLDKTKSSHLKITEGLFAFSKEFATKYSVEIFYAGLEPAIDSETRIFTKHKLGPITIT